MKVEKERLKAAEEVLAEIAQTRPESGFVQRAIAAIRTWLRNNFKRFAELELSDVEIINSYLIPAREFVQRGRTAPQSGLAGAFSRRKVDTNRELAALRDTLRRVRGSDQARKAAGEFLNKPIVNAETGFTAVVTGQSLAKMMSSSAMGKSVSPQAHFQAVGNVDALLDWQYRKARQGKEQDRRTKGPLRPYAISTCPCPSFEKPDATGHRLYTLHALKVETSAPSEEVTRASPGISRTPTSDADVEARFAQMTAIVKGELSPDDAAPALSRSTGQTDAPAFKKWFGDSKVVDESGRPLRVYPMAHAGVSTSSTRNFRARIYNQRMQDSFSQIRQPRRPPYGYWHGFFRNPADAMLYLCTVGKAAERRKIAAPITSQSVGI